MHLKEAVPFPLNRLLEDAKKQPLQRPNRISNVGEGWITHLNLTSAVRAVTRHLACKCLATAKQRMAMVNGRDQVRTKHTPLLRNHGIFALWIMQRIVGDVRKLLWLGSWNCLEEPLSCFKVGVVCTNCSIEFTKFLQCFNSFEMLQKLAGLLLYTIFIPSWSGTVMSRRIQPSLSDDSEIKVEV